jgi:hypothetical protein
MTFDHPEFLIACRLKEGMVDVCNVYRCFITHHRWNDVRDAKGRETGSGSRETPINNEEEFMDYLVNISLRY